MESMLLYACIYLAAAVVAVPFANRLGLGSVLGYLLAGILIGPALGLVGAETGDIQHVAEFGVVMMLFIVGLELEPKHLWELRSRLFGLGGLQLSLTALAIMAVALALGYDWTLGLAIGLVFATSSTAIVLQTLNEKGMARTEGGQASFAVLLFQDIAVIGVLALIPLLAPEGAEPLGAGAHGGQGSSAVAHGLMGLVAGLPPWGYALVVLGAIATLVLASHYLSRPLFRFIAGTGLREVFTATALLLVIATALLMSLVDLSPALGAFLAGVVLANSEFRHELQSDIEPFKGLLMGLFFITVGAGIDFKVLFDDFASLLGLALGVMGIKALILLSLSWVFRLEAEDRSLFALGLAQVGEFGFVLLSYSQQNGVIGADISRALSLVVALSMLLTPAFFIVHDRLIAPRLNRERETKPDSIEEQGTVIIAGIGRFGYIIHRLLVAVGVPTVMMDQRPEEIEILRKLGIKSYYGDASRPDLLEAAGIAQAKLFVVAVDEQERAVQMVEYCRRNYPGVRILARAHDVRHRYLLHKAGADLAVREVFESSLTLGAAALRHLGFHPYKVERMTRAFRNHEDEVLDDIFELWDQDPDIARNLALQARLREHLQTLEDTLKSDRKDLHDRTERCWIPPPRRPHESSDETQSADRPS